jgi:tetratricopeptide (TPR) repeat protein
MLAVEAPHGDFVRYVAGQSEGNPFFVAEYLRAAISRGVLARDARGRFTLEPPSTGSRGYDELGLPSSLRDLIAHRLATLSPRARALAASAAVLGRDVDGELLAAVAAMEDADRLAAMTELLSRQVLEDDGARYRFVHDRIREASLASLDAAAQRACHLAAASTLAARLPDGDARAAELARHWEGAGHSAEAALSYLAAARVSCGRFALAEAQAHYERALCLEALPADAAALARLELASRVLRVRGDGGRAERELQAAVAGAAASGARELERRCLERLAHQRVLNGRNREALAAAGRAAALAVEAGDGGGKALGLHAVGAALRGMGRLRAARGALRRGLDAARAAADDGAACAILTILADLEMELGLPDDALGRLEEAITRERERGDRAGELSALATLASTRHQLGALAEAHALYAEALRLAREIGHRSIEAVVLGNLGTLLATQGRTDGAASAFLQSLAIQRELGRRRAVAVSLMNLCNLYVDLDRLAEAEAFVQESLGIHREAGDRLSEGQALLYLGGVHERRGGLAEARACYEEALDRNLETGDRRFEALSRVGLAAVLRRLGDLDLAGEHLEASRRLLEPHLDGLDLAALACQEGHLALARGGDGRGPLREAERLARALEVAPGSSLHRDVGYLERCVRFREDGGALHLGDLRDELPGRPG